MVLFGAACQAHAELCLAYLINDGKGQPNKLHGSPFPDNKQRCRVHCFQSAVDLSGLCYRHCLVQASGPTSWLQMEPLNGLLK